jgi:hypothetical protein
MDISSITDIDKLKALAYDTLNVIEQQQQNLRILQERIAQLDQQEPPKKK